MIILLGYCHKISLMAALIPAAFHAAPITPPECIFNPFKRLCKMNRRYLHGEDRSAEMQIKVAIKS